MDTKKQRIHSIINSFKKKEIIIILVSFQIYDNKIDIKFQERIHPNVIYNKYERNYNIIIKKNLNKEQLCEIKDLLGKKLVNYSKRVILIIFSEYFFSREPISEIEKNEIIDLFNSLIQNDSGDNDILFLFNFLYKLDKELNQEEKADLKIYLSEIIGEVSLFKLNLKDNLIRDDVDLWFTNESALSYNKKIIFTQKKQTYSDELSILKFNFSLGFGGKKTELNIDEPEYELYQYLNSDINLDICLDLDKKLSYNRKKFMNESISYLSENDQEKIQKKRKLFKKNNDGEDYENKNYYIIQSNTININKYLSQFPNNKIIIQVDPFSSGIFHTNYTEGFSHKINHLKNMIESFKKDLYLNNQNFTKDWTIDKIEQEKEYSRTKKDIDEVYDPIIIDIFDRNPFNIIEMLRPENNILKEIDNINLEILEYDLKKYKFN